MILAAPSPACVRCLVFAAALAVGSRVLPVARAADSSAAGLAPVALVLQWEHQAQFAGYYLALEKKFYEREGLDVQIQRGGPGVRPCETVAGGGADFCLTMLSTALEKRAAGLPLVLVAQIVNRSNFVLIAWKHPPSDPAATISRPSDLTGRRVTVWESDFRLPYLAFFDAQNARPEVLPQYYTLSLFLHKGADACSAMRYNEYHLLMQYGVQPGDLTVFNLWENGVVLPEDGVYALEKTWRERPEVCRGFARATLAGWRYAHDHPEEALDAVMRQIDATKVPTNRPHMGWMLREILLSIFPGPGDSWTPGRLSERAYSDSVALLERHGSLQGAPGYQDFVTPEARDAAP